VPPTTGSEQIVTTLVTGATGFVGSAVCRRLLEIGHQVRVLVRESSSRLNLEGLAVDIVVGDLRDPRSLSVAVRDCEALFHVAADYRLWALRSADLYESNVDGSIALLRAAADAGVQRIVYTSSVATLGHTSDDTPANEDTPVNESMIIGHYKRSKFIAEREVRMLAKREHLPLVTVNPSTPIGPRDVKPTPTGRVILNAAAGKIPAYVDTGLNIVHVDDVADGHVLAFERGEIGARYILGGEDWTLRQILASVAEQSGRRPPSIRLPHQLVMPLAHVSQTWARLIRAKREPMLCVDGVRMSRRKMFFSSAKAIEKLGYQPRPSREALKDALTWFREYDYL